jgi:hypothetical protein
VQIPDHGIQRGDPVRTVRVFAEVDEMLSRARSPLHEEHEDYLMGVKSEKPIYIILCENILNINPPKEGVTLGNRERSKQYTFTGIDIL